VRHPARLTWGIRQDSGGGTAFLSIRSPRRATVCCCVQTSAASHERSASTRRERHLFQSRPGASPEPTTMSSPAEPQIGGEIPQASPLDESRSSETPRQSLVKASLHVPRTHVAHHRHPRSRLLKSARGESYRTVAPRRTVRLQTCCAIKRPTERYRRLVSSFVSAKPARCARVVTMVGPR